MIGRESTTQTASGSPSATALFAPDAGVRVDAVRIAEGEVIHVALQSARHRTLCVHEASRVHNVYVRSLANLAWRDFRAALRCAFGASVARTPPIRAPRSPSDWATSPLPTLVAPPGSRARSRSRE